MAHSIIYAFAVHYCAKAGATAAKMATHRIEFFRWNVQEFGGFTCYILMAGSMKAVFANAQIVSEILR